MLRLLQTQALRGRLHTSVRHCIILDLKVTYRAFIPREYQGKRVFGQRYMQHSMSSTKEHGGEENEVDFPRDINKSSFETSIIVNALKIPKERCNGLRKLLSEFLLNKPKIRNVEKCEDVGARLLLLTEGLETTDFSTSMVRGERKQEKSMSLQDIIDQEKLQVTKAKVTVGYDSMSTNDILRRLLPAEHDEIPGSFEAVGHIAHLNLRSEMLKYKYIIAKVIVDKNPGIKTVVNKLGTITNEYRVFDMEVLYGDGNTVTEVKQHGHRFRLDFRNVYWNSRLDSEHWRLVQKWFKKGDIVVDAMAGIGPFAIPAAREKECIVYANDLNPESFRWLKENIQINKVDVKAYNQDAREFLRKAVKGELSPAKEGDIKSPAFDHVVMNLPASAVEFLDCLKGEFDLELWQDKPMPMVHVYTFMQATESIQDLQTKIEGYLGGSLEKEPEYFDVRDVAPGKTMMCCSFQVPKAVALGQILSNKRIKL